MSEVFDSLLDVPLDEVEPDADDRIVPGDEGVTFSPPEVRFLMAAVGEPPTLVVPYRGPLKVGMKNLAVRAMKRALSRAGYIKWHRFDNVFYKGTRAFLVEFQKDVLVEVTGIYDLPTHRKLARFYDAYSIQYLLGEPISADDKIRNGFLAQLMYLYNRRYSLIYTQARPFDLRRPPRGLDCSASGEWAAKWTPLPSPSGYSTFGYGNTDTQFARFRAKGWIRSSIREAKIADPKYYGVGSDPSHVAYFVGRKDGTSRVWSFGHFPIGIYDHDYRHDGLAGGVCNLTGK